MSFPKSFVTSSVLAGITFCSATLPMAALNSTSVAIQLDEDPVFMGQIEDIAAPYLGFATAISLGVGAISLSTMSWRHASKKLSDAEDQIQALRHQLQEQEGLIESLQFSETRLEAAGLSSFIEEDEFQLGEDDLKKLAIASATGTGQAAASQAMATSVLTKSQAAHYAAAAQPQDAAQAQQDANLTDDPAQLTELLGQLKVVMAQVEKLHVVDSDMAGQSNQAAPAA
ncbi:MAG: hypothetical protein ACFB8W_08350 [Elainellaceae cyanobacterium]